MKFLCKYCNKSYSCGKALGGHLSSHKTAMDYDYDDYRDVVDDDDFRPSFGGLGTAFDDGYASKAHGDGLLHHHHVCKECGKGFRSLKALCGHMACHSEKDRRRYASRVGDKQRRLYGEDAVAECSETVDSGRSQQQEQQPCRRSKRVRFMNRARSTVEEFEDGFSFFSGTMSVEEVARCLMMMSNDRRFTGCCGRVADYSGSPSAESEDKPPSSGGFSGSPKSSDEISYEPKQGYKILDTLKGGYTTKRIVKRGVPVEHAAAAAQEKKYNAKKKENRHECPICFRVFKSGQAMGGHKRSHFLGGAEEAASSSMVMTEKEVPMIDLNFPAFVEEGDDGGGGRIFPW